MAAPDLDYDTDAISITSTVSSTKTETYNVTAILSERLTYDENGHRNKRYLIEWDGYPLHRCTWEPEENLEGTDLLNEWDGKKARMGEQAFRRYTDRNETIFDKALKKAEDAKALRHQKRVKKRAKYKKRSRPVAVANDSEEDVSPVQQKRTSQQNTSSPRADPTVSQEERAIDSLFFDSQELSSCGPAAALEQTEEALFVKQHPVARKPFLEQSSSEVEEEDASPSDGDTDDSLLVELKDKAQKGKRKTATTKEPRRDPELTLGNSILSTKNPRKKAAAPLTKPATKKSEPRVQRQEHVPKSSKTPAFPPAHNQTEKTTVHKSTEVQQKTKTPGQPAAQSPKMTQPRVSNATGATDSVTALKHREGTQTVRHNHGQTATSISTNTAQTSSSAAAQRPSGSTSITAIRKSGAGTKAAPPINFVNEPKTRLRKEWNTKDKLYNKLKFQGIAEKRGRTEGTPDPTRLEFVGAAPTGLVKPKPSNPTDNPYGRREGGNRRMQEVDADDSPQQHPTDNTTPLRTWETDKAPLVCPYWRLSSNCPYGPEKCNFMHRNKDEQGRDYPVGEPGGRLPPKYRKPPQTCFFWMMSKAGCKKPDAECNYAHRNTGWMPESEENGGKVIQIDPSAAPASELTLQLRRLSQSDSISRHEKKRKNPAQLTCWYWTNGKCRNRPENCAFQHFDTGVVADPPPGVLTCHKWLEGRCHLPGDVCKFQHYHTGFLSDQPSIVHNTTPPLAVSSHANRWTDITVAQPSQGVHPDGLALIPTLEPSVASDVEMNDVSLLQSMEDVVLQLPQLPLEPPQPPQSHPLASSVTERPPTLAPPEEQPLAPSSCLQLKQKMEEALRIQFADLFEWTIGDKDNTMVDRKAFLLYHPQDHSEELDIITRWLLMHHMEVSSAWYDGSWDYFRQQIANGASGVVIASPDFEYFSELPDFGQVLCKHIRFWSVGMQEGIEYDSAVSDSPSQPRHDCIEIFPVGGFIYITDDVFEKKPQVALRIVKLFFAKIEKLRQFRGPISPWQEVNDVSLLWRLCVRPELMEYLIERCEEHGTELAGGDPDVSAKAELYTLFSNTNYIEQDSPAQPLSTISDKYPVLSERRIIAKEKPVDYFNTLARSQEEANLHMIRYYAGLQIDMRRDYRYFFVVHTEPSAPCVREWKSEIQTIANVITPEQCAEELGEDGREGIFDFCESYMPKVKVETVEAAVASQVSQEDGEIRSA